MAPSGTDPALVTTAVLVTFVLFAVVSLAYKLVEQHRRRAWRGLAETLGGELDDDGSPYGSIEARIGDGRACRVGTERLHRSVVTVITVGCGVPDAPPAGVALGADCFGPTTEWDHALTEGRVPHRVFVATVHVPAMVELDAAQRAWLARVFDPRREGMRAAAIRADLEAIDARAIRVEPASLSITFSGVVTERQRVRSTLELLDAVARRFESVPVAEDTPVRPAA